MRLLKFLAISIIVLVVVAVLGLWGYLNQQKPQYSGEITIAGLERPVEIRYDEFGIPHISGENASDSYFALGYVHAQDRLFQMDLLRRIGSGRLSEFFGEATLEVDRLFHTIGIPEYAQSSVQQLEEMDPEMRLILERYLDGVNYFAETGPAPIEYLIGGLPREPFEVVDIYHTAGFMAFSFALGLRTDPLVQHIQDEFGDEYLQDLALHHYPNQALAPSGRTAQNMPDFSNDVMSQLDKLPFPFFTGSNTWVVSGEKTKSGKPIFANDTHIQYTQPGTWYEAHLKFPGTNLYGDFLAGIPFAIIGHNNRIAWGMTMFENDDTDFYSEEYHPEDTSLVRYQNNLWVELEEQEVIINVKGGTNDTLLIRKSPHGPLMNELFDQSFDSPVSMFWTYTQKTNELPEAFFALNNATKIEDARSAVQRIHAPGLNISYADVDGNIALWSAAHLIHRPEHVNSKLILNGGSGADDPLGYYPFEANPQLENPESGMVYSANSQHDTTEFGMMHPGYYTPSVRMERIAHLLNQKDDWTISEMKTVVNDHISAADADLAHHFYDIIKSSGDESLVQFFEPLKDWEGDHDVQSTVPVIYYPLMFHLIEGTFADELGDDQFEAYLQTHLMKRTNFRIFEMDESVWFDDVTTDAVETKADIVSSAAIKAMNQLEQLHRDQPMPGWGAVHTVTFAHAMGSVKPLDRLFNNGPYEISGTNESINQQGFVPSDSSVYPVKHGPQMRILLDMSEIENSISINPTGQSGNRFSKHYKDQSPLFVNGEFRPQLMNREEIEKQSPEALILIPEK